MKTKVVSINSQPVKSKLDLNTFLKEFKGYLTARQISAIHNGLVLTERLEKYATQALGLRPDLAETKKNTILWSPPGAGKTFTVRNVIEENNLQIVKFHGKASLNSFTIKMAVHAYCNQDASHIIPVWIDDCDAFFKEKESLDFMKIVLDNENPVISWDVNMTTEIAKAENTGMKTGDLTVANALKHFNNGGVGIEIPGDQFRFIITTNKKLASKQEVNAPRAKKIAIDEHAIRDRVNWRAFDINSEEAWGWMASVMLTSDVFAKDGFSLDPMQIFQLLQIFHTHWDELSANSMRTVKEAGALLYNNPDTFADEFEQNFLS
jgi:hypothetical protein